MSNNGRTLPTNNNDVNLLTKDTESPSDRLWRVMNTLSSTGNVIFPSDATHPDRKLLKVKYAIFLDQIKTQQRYREMVAATEAAIASYLSL
jgi:hypothetical protein